MNSSCSDKGGGGKSVTGQVRIGHYRSKLHGERGNCRYLEYVKHKVRRKGKSGGVMWSPAKEPLLSAVGGGEGTQSD